MSVDREDAIADAQTGALRRRVRQNFADDRLDQRANADFALGSEIRLFAFGNERRDVMHALAQVLDAKWRAGMNRDDETKIIEVIDRITVDGNDAIADLQSCAR